MPGVDAVVWFPELVFGDVLNPTVSLLMFRVQIALSESQYWFANYLS